MINLLAICPNPKDATSLYRGMGPLNELIKSQPNLRVGTEPEFSWASMTKYDAVFLQRPYTRVHRDIVEFAKSMNIPVWIDYDDDLFCVPTDNPTYHAYASEETQKNVAVMLNLADAVSVSTNAIKNRVGEVAKFAKRKFDVWVIPNALNMGLFGWRGEISGAGNKLIMWRGSKTHHRDVMGYAEPIIETAKQRTEWTWNFIGDQLWFITDMMPHKNTIVMEAMDPIKYNKHICDVSPAVGIIPLHDSPFNRAKSNIAWMEYTMAGAACLVPSWDEWKLPGAVSYSDQSSFKSGLDSLLGMNHGQLKELRNESWAHVKSKYDLSIVNDQRIELLEFLTGKMMRPSKQFNLK